MTINYIEKVQELTLLDDVLMTAVFKDDTELTAFVLKIILNRDLKVISVKVQDTLKNLKGRSVRLDIYAEAFQRRVAHCLCQQFDSRRYAARTIDARFFLRRPR